MSIVTKRKNELSADEEVEGMKNGHEPRKESRMPHGPLSRDNNSKLQKMHKLTQK